jgi:hypothetical protein
MTPGVHVTGPVVSIVKVISLPGVMLAQRDVTLSMMAGMAMRVVGHRGRQERQAQSGQSDQLRPSRGRAGAKSPFVFHGEPPVWGLSNCQIRASPKSRLYVIEKAHVTREYLDPGRG